MFADLAVLDLSALFVLLLLLFDKLVPLILFLALLILLSLEIS